MDESRPSPRCVPLSARPAVPAAVLFILGISTHTVVPHGPGFWLVVTAALAAASAVRHWRREVRCTFLALSLLAVGLSAAQLAAGSFPANHIGAFLEAEPRLAWVEMRIDDAPRLEEQDRGRPAPPRQLFPAEVLRVRARDGQWAESRGAVRVTLTEPNESLAAGQTVRALGLLSHPAPQMNPGEFDRADLDRRLRVLATLHVAHAFHVQPVEAGWASVRARAGEAARRLLARGFDAARATDRAVLLALALGYREPAVRDVDERFQHSGTAHLLANNGARIALLAALVYLLCRILCVRPRVTAVAVVAAAALYGLATAPSPQATRPVLLCAAVGFGMLGRRSVDAVHMLALAALAILACNPLDLYGAGFQLSFVTVLGMILFTGPVVRFLERWEDPDLRVLASFGRLGPLGRVRRRLFRDVSRAAAAAGVAWVASAPLVAYHFEQVNPWTVPASMALAPFAFLGLAAGILKVLLTAALPPFAHAWAACAAVPAELLRWGVGLLARLPAADIPLTRPPVWAILVYYALLAAVLLAPRVRWPRLRLCLRCGPAAACALVLLAPALVGLSRRFGSGDEVRVTLLSVGAGQCAVVEPPDGRLILIDAGSSTLPDVMRQALAPFLRHEGRRHVDEVFLSHGDYDHIGAADAAVTEYGANEVVVSPHFRQHAPESAPCARLLEMLDRTGHSPRLAVAGDSIDIGGGAKVDVLWPPASSRMNSNNTGLVLRLTFGGRSILFPADIQEPAERALLRHPERLRADVLVAPHHGSAESSTAAFIAAVNPRAVISSNAHALTAKQRAFDRIVDGRLFYRTGQCGAITVLLDRQGGVKVTPFLPDAGMTSIAGEGEDPP